MSSQQLKQYALALHTTTPQLGIAINNFQGDNRSQIWDLGKDLSSYLHQHLDAVLTPQTWQDIKFIAVAKGPGGFTGTRIGVATARTISQQLDIPLYGISTLKAIADQYRNCDCSQQLIAVQMNARRGELFVAIYQAINSNKNLQTQLSDTIMTPDLWQKTLNQLTVPYQLITAKDHLANTATNLLHLAHERWQQDHFPQWFETTPFYGQKPV